MISRKNFFMVSMIGLNTWNSKIRSKNWEKWSFVFFLLENHFFYLKLMMMMNCFYGMVDRRKAFSLISSRDHCQRSSPSRISDTPRAGFEPAQNQSSGLVEWSCAVVITTTPPFQPFVDTWKIRNSVED